jgi:hypothetical protein
MAFLVYFVVMIIASGAVLFGLDVVTAPLPQHHAAPPAMSSASKPNKAAKREADAARQDVAANNKELTPVYPANPGGVREVVADKTASTTPGVAPAAPPPVRETSSVTTGVAPAAAAAEVPAPVQKPAAKTAEAAAPVQKPAVKTAEVSPSSNAAPPPAPVAQAVVQQSAGHCDVQSCASAYHSFRASDCTYQPYEGARRACIAPPATQARNDPAPARVARQNTRASMVPDAAPRSEELRRGQSNNDEDDYDDDDDDDASAYGSANAYAPANGYRGSIVVIRRPRGW